MPYSVTEEWIKNCEMLARKIKAWNGHKRRRANHHTEAFIRKIEVKDGIARPKDVIEIYGLEK